MRRFFLGWMGLFMLVLLTNANVSAASANTCAVTFQNNKGTSSSDLYKKLNQKVKAGTKITLPSVSIRGYQILGWTTKKGRTTPLYKVGKSFKITKDTTFYLVRKKAVYSVSFYSNGGKTNAAFQALQKTGYYGTAVSLPEGPALKGYRWMGWTDIKSSAVVKYQNGASITLSQNTRLYGIYRRTARVTFYDNHGTKVFKSITVIPGETCTLPAMASTRETTFLGWSLQPDQIVSPQYTANDTISVTADQKLYAVCFLISQEPDLTRLPLPDTGKYKKVIFVGDSRTQQARDAFRVIFGITNPTFKNVEFVALSGSGFNWLKSTGYRKLLEKIGEGGTEEKPIAVIFNHGVNDLNPTNSNPEYAPFMKQIAKELSAKHAVLCYMSVNPMNRADYEATGRKYTLKYEDRILTFNQMIRNTLCADGTYQYIDAYQYLMSTGFSYDGGNKINGQNLGRSDGLHYSVQTYKRIYAYCMDVINR